MLSLGAQEIPFARGRLERIADQMRQGSLSNLRCMSYGPPKAENPAAVGRFNGVLAWSIELRWLTYGLMDLGK